MDLSMNQRGFASDNNAGVLPEVMLALANVNKGHTVGYGGDDYTEMAIKLFKRELGISTEVFLVYNGTGANVIAIQAMARPFEAVICAETAHINVDECGAPEKHAGCKLTFNPKLFLLPKVPKWEHFTRLRKYETCVILPTKMDCWCIWMAHVYPMLPLP
jgi:hypothetical protein